MNVSAVIVTRGDVDLAPVLASLPADWPVVVWDNSQRKDLSVYGRYAALAEVETPLVYVQDDDVIVSDPAALLAPINLRGDLSKRNFVVCNMPQEFRPHYPDSALVGFGACFERDLPQRAFERYAQTVPTLHLSNYGWSMPGKERFNNECDVAFTTLTPRILVDVPKIDREFASDPNRLWKRPEHVAERAQVLELARMVRDA